MPTEVGKAGGVAHSLVKHVPNLHTAVTYVATLML
jgi:hypothetical protein